MNNLILTHLDPNTHTSKPSGAANGSLRNKLFKTIPASIKSDYFVDEVTLNGRTFSTALMDGQGSKRSNYKESNLFVLDIDNEGSENVTIQEVLNYFTFLNVNPFLVYHTFSSTPQKHKFRMVFKLHNKINDLRIFKMISNLLVKFYTLNFPGGSLDSKVTIKPEMFYFGTNSGAIHYDPDMYLNINNLFKLVRDMDQIVNLPNRTHKRSESKLMSDCGILKYNLINELSLKNLCIVLNPDCKTDAHLHVILSIYNIVDTYASVLRSEIVNNANNSIFLSKYGDNIYIFYLKYDDFNSKNIKSGSDLDLNVTEYDIDNISIRGGLDKVDKKILKKLSGQCEIIKRFLLKEYLNHDDRFILSTFLNNFSNGTKVYKHYMNDIGKKFDTNLDSMIKYKYNTARCNNRGECCTKNHNIKNMYIDIMNNKIYKEDKILSDVDSTRDLMQLTIKNILNNKDSNIHIVDVGVGIGKTSYVENFINRSNFDNYMLAFGLHNKKEEFRNRAEMIEDLFIQHPLPDCIKDEDLEIIKKLNNQHKSYLNFLKSLTGEDKYSVNNKIIIQKYINEYMDIFFYSKVYTTHAKAIHLWKNKKIDRLIFDEDPINTLLNNIQVSRDDIDTLIQILKNKESNTKINNLIKFYKEIFATTDYNEIININNKKVYNTDWNEIFNYEDYNNLNITTPALDLIKSDYYIIDGHSKCVTTIIKTDIPENKQVLILSATPQTELYKSMYGDRVVVHKLSDTNIKGNLYQIPKSHSKNYFNLNKDAVNNIFNIYNDYNFNNIITFKNIKDELIKKGVSENNILNYGAIEGINTFENTNIIVAGTFIPPANYLKILYYTIYKNKVDKIKFKNQSITWDSCTFNYYCPEDEDIRNLYLDFIFTHLIQAVGRARLVNNYNCNVLLLSNFILYDSKIIDESELNIINNITYDKTYVNFENYKNNKKEIKESN